MPTEFTIMTYNVHSCVGTDGKSDPARIAGVIAAEKPDIAALQELDRSLTRTGLLDQGKAIAEHLEMHYHFHPLLEIEDGHYGNAILSRFPMQPKKAAELPTLPSRKNMERRGALWVELSAGERRIQVINTHLGLNRQERIAQAEMLLSSEWLGHPACRPPVVLCGDFNSLSRSKVLRWLSVSLRNASQHSRTGAARSYPSRFPLLALDYILVSPDIAVREFRVGGGSLPRRASDHLPVIARCEVP